jgi:minor extracellular serine protease Vpr
MKYTLLIFVLIYAFNSMSQKKCSVLTQADLEIISRQILKNDKKILEDLKRNYSISTINKTNYISFLAKVQESFVKKSLIEKEFIFGTQINDIITFKVPLELINTVESIPGLIYYEMALKVKQNLDQAIKDVHADSVQKGINLPQAYTGKDVYIGITDWGFDYTHPNFYDTLLNETRIEAAWDQYKQSGPNPNGFSYGTEYNTIDELLTANSDTANIYSYAYHGSHVAGITGGSGAGTPYRGVAFEAKFLMATFLIDAASVIDAYEWMYQKSVQDEKRLVINQSWGLHHIGNLDGTSLLSQAIDYYSQLGVVFVSSAGNNGDVLFHIKKDFLNDTIATRVNFYTYSFPTMWGQSVSLWGEENHAFGIQVQILNPSNTLASETPFYHTNLQNEYLDSMLIIGSDTIFFNLASENVNPLNNRPHMRLRIKNTNTSYKVVLKMTALDGIVHAWNLVELTNDVGNWGQSFSKINSTYTQGDNLYGISEPACTKSTIAVAAYTTYAGLASFSSRGPTLDERNKPDIAAPGVNIASSISSYTDASVTSLTTIDFDGRTYPFSRLSGTSMSGPMVTGIVALILEANPYLSSQQVKEIIQETARTDNYTNTIPIEGSTSWGKGKINAYKAIQLALQTIGNVMIYENTSESFVFYPNPTKDIIVIKLNSKINEIQVVDYQGKSSVVSVFNNQFSLSNFKNGIYLILFESNGKIYQKKIVKQE